jgi:hypothetical protein
MSEAAGMAALGFWLFLAAIIVAGIWYDARRKESQQETLRRIVESGKDIDPELIDRVIGKSESKNAERDLRVSAYITLSVAPGLLILGWFLGMIDDDARFALMGVAMLVACVGGGMLLAAESIRRRYGSK